MLASRFIRRSTPLAVVASLLGLVVVATANAQTDPPVVSIPKDGEVPSPTTTPQGAASSVLSYDMQVADALMRADAKRVPSSAIPIRPVLPAVRTIDGPILTPKVAHTPLGATASGRAPSQVLDTCGGPSNCYQSDSAFLTDYPDDVYAYDYQLWLGVPETNESNKCDNVSTSGCFWFQAAQYNTNGGSASLHVGPQRGDSLAGNAGTGWKISISGYNSSGAFVGGLSNVALVPTATWVRVRIWRASYTGATSTWQVYALWGGIDRYLGSISINGNALTYTLEFMEVYEENNQCLTDFVRTYFNAPAALSASAGWLAPAHGTANYETKCASNNTTWKALGGSFISDERETTARPIAQGASLW
jgi:hypothetical protein